MSTRAIIFVLLSMICLHAYFVLICLLILFRFQENGGLNWSILHNSNEVIFLNTRKMHELIFLNCTESLCGPPSSVADNFDQTLLR